MALTAGVVFVLGPLLMTSLGLPQEDAFVATSLLVIFIGGCVIVWPLRHNQRSTD